MLGEALINGACDARFAAVRTAFQANFAERGECGAAVCVILNGKPVVDLYGGWRDEAQHHAWGRDSLVNLWSTTKGVAAACFAMLVERGLARYDDPVAHHWPEFAANGKGAITIAMLLSHQAGLCGFTTPATVADLLSGDAAAARLAAQTPLWEPGSASGYHAVTYGILATALFERIEGRSLKQFVAEELAGGQSLDISIGLSPGEEHRRAEMLAPPKMRSSGLGDYTPPQIAALGNPALSPLLPNTPEWRAADLPSANGHSNAAALASLYARLIDPAGGLISAATLEQAIALRIEGEDLVLGIRARWGAGFLLNTDGVYGPNPRSFGHSGWGGSFAFADPDAGIAMSYTMNRMGTLLRGDPRAVALVSACYASL